MRLVQLLTRESNVSRRRLGLMGAIAGGSSAGVLAIVSTAAGSVGADSYQLQEVVLFALAVLGYFYTQRYVLVTTTDEVEKIVHRYRERLITNLAACELKGLEHIGRGAIFSAICTDTQVISQSAGSLVLGLQAAILIFWATLYLATLSTAALVVVIVIMAVAARLYQQRMVAVRRALRDANDSYHSLHDVVSGLLDGFKEVKLSHRRAEEVVADAMAISRQTNVFRTEAQRALGLNFVFTQIAFFIILGAMVFVLPVLSPTYTGTIMKSLAAVMFLIGPISGIITAVPQVAVASAAADNLHDVSRLIDAHSDRHDAESGVAPIAPPVGAFRSLEMRGIVFRHTGPEGFSVGPLDLSIRAGEVIFVTGGNGSGKTTLIKLLTGLYPPDGGLLLVNGTPTTAASAQQFRERFCAVFSDFHLFPKFYGIDAPDPAVAQRWLDDMELADKVSILPTGFSTVDLSHGQRKRLAFISAMLEDKPIVVLDEWAADQDPHFRAKFYQKLIPQLKAAGKTVIAITHDDRYFDVADRRVHMDEGRLTIPMGGKVDA